MILPAAATPLGTEEGDNMSVLRYRDPSAIALAVLIYGAFVTPAFSQQCSPTQLNNHTNAVPAPCLCFIPNEQAGAVFTAPAGDYPLEILKIGIQWGSTFGGNPQSQELALHIYAAGLPNPGAAQFSLPAPVLTDGIMNVFDISQVAGSKTIGGGAFTVTLEFLNQNSGQQFASSMEYDADGCTANQNVVYAQPGGWADACNLGVLGDWIMYVEYRCLAPVPSEDGSWGAIKVLYANDR
jgi:hypothetical protein